MQEANELPVEGVQESRAAARQRLLALWLSMEQGPRMPPGRRGHGGRIPLSCAQERLWFLNHMGLAADAYNVPVALRLSGELDPGALQRSFTELLRRHESLRTRFELQEGTPYQQVDPDCTFALRTLDLGRSHPGEQERGLHEVIETELRGRFLLSQGPLLRATLIRLSAHEHVLLMVMHHIAADGWSVSILLRELGALYCAYSRHLPSPLPELGFQYADYALWQREWLAGASLARDLQYWREQLTGAPPQLRLPTDRPRPSQESFRGAVRRLQLPSGLMADLKSLALSEGATLFMVMLAAYQVLLARWSGQSDVVVGAPIAGRTRRELEGLIGFFVNTLALRTDLSGVRSFRELIRAVKTVTLGAYAHQDLPFERLVAELKPERSLGHQPIVNVMLALHNFPADVLEFRGLQVTRMPVDYVTAHFDLTLYLQEMGGGMQAEFEYATDLFDAPTIDRLAQRWETLLRGVVAQPDADPARLPLLGEAEAHQVLLEWNDTDVPLGSDRCVHELVEEQVARTPDAIAVVHQGRQLTYAQLEERANHLAGHLRRRGAGKGGLVGICVERSIEMVVGLLGILKAGAAYVPLDPNYPAERLRHMVRDARPTLVLTQCGLVGRLEGSETSLVYLDEVLKLASVEEGAEAPPRPTAEDLVYVIYTSGSTGLPKGTAMEHGAMVNLLEWHRSTLGSPVGVRVLQFAALSFDVAFQETFSTLATGGTLVLVDENTRRDPRALTQYLQELRVQRLFVPPLMLQGIAEACLEGETPPTHLSDIITAGEQLRISPEVVALFERLPGCRLHNHYGPTETHVVTALTLEGEARGWPALPAIGRPIANTRIYVLDRERQPVPLGATGEIYIGGRNLARGYLGRPEMAVQRFIECSIENGPVMRLYRTGDLGRWRTDGTLEYLGREDGQVKLRGYRVEVGEIEAQLVRQPAVKEAIVVVREDTPGNKRLVAYLLLREPGAFSPEEARQQLKRVLPEYMIPAAFVVLDRYPQTPSGKADRKALPPPPASAHAGQVSEAPVGGMEPVIARVWESLLGLSGIGRDANFFDLGGHSLLAVKALAQINQQLRTDLKVTDLYNAPTVRELAAVARGMSFEDAPVDLAKESVLEEGLRPGVPAVLEARPAGILLTGATGFVGRFLLSELLAGSDAPIYCLVRADSDEQAGRRLRECLSAWDLESGEAGRLIALAGDLGAAGLGLSASRWEELTRRVGSIYHCGTSMNHLETYAMAKAANVGSAHTLLRLAARGPAKVIHYLSTLGVFRATPATRARVVDESTPIDGEIHRSSQGYLASKWVGEKIFLRAAAQGFACNILRVGLVWADSRQGRYDELQREYRLLKSALLMGSAPEGYRFHSPPTPVDFVARAVAALAQQHPQGGGIFHLSSSAQLSEGYFECVRRVCPGGLALLPMHAWVQELKRRHLAGESLPIVPLLQDTFHLDEAQLQQYLEAQQAAVAHVEHTRTRRALEAQGVVEPPLDERLVRLSLESALTRDPQLRAQVQPRREAPIIVEASGGGQSLALDDYRLLGRSGLRVSPVALGTMTFGTEWGWGADPEEARGMFETYLERGGNFIDTANQYTNGMSETLLGEFAAGRRDRLVIATKYTLPVDARDPNSGGNHRKSMVRSVERSLQRLGTDYLDLLYLHAWDDTTPVEEILRAMDDLVRAGKVLYLGISDTVAWQVSRMQAIADLRGWAPLVALQLEYSLLERTAERELIPMAAAMGLGVIAWSPLGSGVLTGKYTREDLDADRGTPSDPGSRKPVVLTQGLLTQRGLSIAEAVKEIAREIGRTPAQVALAWVLGREQVTSPIVGARTLRQLQENLDALAVQLSSEHRSRLDELSAIAPGFPHEYLALIMRRGGVYGNTRITRGR